MTRDRPCYSIKDMMSATNQNQWLARLISLKEEKCTDYKRLAAESTEQDKSMQNSLKRGGHNYYRNCHKTMSRICMINLYHVYEKGLYYYCCVGCHFCIRPTMQHFVTTTGTASTQRETMKFIQDILVQGILL